MTGTPLAAAWTHGHSVGLAACSRAATIVAVTVSYTSALGAVAVGFAMARYPISVTYDTVNETKD